MKKIDIHAHTTMWENGFSSLGRRRIMPHELKKEYEELGVEKGFILPLLSPEALFSVQSNEEAEYIANNNSDFLYWCCNVDPRMLKNLPDADLSVMLNSFKERGAVAVGEVTANLYIDDPYLENLFYHCSLCDMPAIIHMAAGHGGTYGIIDDLGLPRLEKLLKKYPNLKIIGHSQCFWSEIGDNVTEDNRSKYPEGKVNEGRVAKILRECPNLFCDLSAGSGFNALNRDTDYAYRFIEEFSDRLMFGTDFVVPNQKNFLSKWLDESFEKGFINEENYKKICRENAIRIFKLKDLGELK